MAPPEAAAPGAAIAWLRTPQAIRVRAGMVLAAAECGTLEHFALDASRLDPAADYVIETIRTRYPDLDIPYHSRWRHFAVGGHDRWTALAAGLDADRDEVARARFDLVVTSVLLDAGAGDAWRYSEPGTGAYGFRRHEPADRCLEVALAGRGGDHRSS